MLTIQINTANAAFTDNGGAEIAKILERLTYAVPFKLADGVTSGTILDSNGNSVGTWSFTEEDADHQPTKVVDDEGDVWRRSSDGRWWCGVDDSLDVDGPEVGDYSFLTVATLADVESRYGIREVLS